MNAARQCLEQNLRTVEDRLTRACLRAGRKRSEVALVAVTKTVSAQVAALLPELGITHLGENRPQELLRKSELLTPNISWHLIGHLQRNKVDRVVSVAALIHSVDSVRLLEALEQEATKKDLTVAAFLEVNASGEASKHGFLPSETSALVERIHALRHVQVRGLMTMAALQEPEACRPTFQLLRRLRDELNTRLGPSQRLAHLSMGMSNDFEVAVEEGATYVRLGSVLFEGVAEE